MAIGDYSTLTVLLSIEEQKYKETEQDQQKGGAGMNWFNFIKKKPEPYVYERTNIIQYDEMGYPLRLFRMSDGSKRWLDTIEESGDIVLRRTTEFIPLEKLLDEGGRI